jgi:hypothetical protein
MLIPKQSTKFVVRIFPTRNACPQAVIAVGVSLRMCFGRANESRMSFFLEVENEIL